MCKEALKCVGCCGSTHPPAYSILVKPKASDKTIICYRTAASREVSPKYLTSTTTERIPAQGGMWSPVKSLCAVGSEDDGYYM